ncbi:MAG: double zinc ribbon domain-containing protein [Gaiellaceae bacterium]
MGFSASLLDLLLPERCVACRVEGGLLCRECRAGLLRLGGTLCARCGAPTAWPVERCGECAGRRVPFGSARAAVAYEGAARRLVGAWKERGLGRIARLAADLVAENVPPPRVDALTWIPGDADRSRWRGVNPAEGLARELAARWELPAVALLKRTRPIARQRGLPRSARRKNVQDAFSATTAPAVVAVVDDVYTTGATAAVAAAALKRSGAGAVHVVTFARAVRR